MAHLFYKKPRHKGGFKASQFVGGADEEAVNGGNASAFFVGGEELDERMADDDAHVVHRAASDHHEECKPEPNRIGDGQAKTVLIGDAEQNGGDAKSGDGEQHGAPGFLHGRAMGQEEGAEDRADRHGGSEDAQAAGAALEDVLGKNGKYSRGSAEQDGK